MSAEYCGSDWTRAIRAYRDSLDSQLWGSQINEREASQAHV